jgi:hypothetical protein
MLQTHEEIKKWLDGYGIRNYTIRPGGVIDVDGHVDLLKLREKMLPVQFGTVSGNFFCSNADITSLKGVPQRIYGYFSCYGTNITSLEYAPQHVGGDFHCNQARYLRSLSGTDKIIKHVGGRFCCDDRATHLLSLLLIEGIKKIDVDNNDIVGAIMSKYCGTGDILSAQDELIDAGFIDQARL